MNLKSLLTIGAFLLAYAFTYAQPANDDPCNAALLSVESTCAFQSFTNVNATSASGLTDPSCGSYMGGDVWFKFDMPLNGKDVLIDLGENGGIANAAMAVYSGPDCSNLTELICDDNSGLGLMPQLTVDNGCTNSNGGITYWIRVWEFENDIAGTFDICTYVAAPNAPIVGCGSFLPPANTCCDAVITSLCEIDGYCSSSANAYTVTATENVPFCAVIENNSWISFIANSPNIELEFLVSNCAFDFGIQAQLFETTDCSNFTIASTCFNPGPGASLDGSLIADNLVPGNTYYLMVDGWASDNCDYTIYVKDLSPEVEVTTIPSTICAGQTTQLNAEIYGTGNYTFSWTPTANLSDPTISNPVASPTVTTTYSVAITGLCEAITTYDVTISVDPDVPTNLMVVGQGIVCDSDLNQSYTLTGDNLVTNNWTVTGGSIVGPTDGTTVNVNWNSAGGTICVDASNGCGSAPQECVVVSVSPEPSISMASPVTGCSDPGIDLNTITVNDANNSIGLVTFYDNVADANAGTPELASATVTTSGTYWVRKESAPSCYDVASVDLVIEEPDISVVDPTAVCAPNTVDLSSAFVSDANGLSGTKQYYPTLADAENITNELTSTIVSTTGAYWVRFTTSSGCSDIAQINATIDDTPSLSAMEASFCEGEGIDLATIAYTDANNTTITNELYYDNYTLAITGLPGFALANTEVQDSGYYYLVAETAAGCSDILALHAVFAQNPEGSLSAATDLCVGDSIYLSFNLSGTPPFDVEYSDGTSTYNLTGINNGHVEAIEVNTTTTFTLTSFTNGNCQGVITNGAVTANVSNSANANLTGDASICLGGTTDIIFNVDAPGLFDLVISDGTLLDTMENIADGFAYTVSPSVNTTYNVVNVFDNNYPSCDVNYSGSVNVSVNTASDTTSVQFICNNTNTQYQVVIDIEGGDPSSYVVNGDPGTLVGSQFTSDLINSGAPYSFVVTDAANCNPVTVAGSYECGCATDAGEMIINAGEYCPGDLILITHNNQQVLDSDDAFGYIMHDSADASIGNVVASNNSGAFTFDSNTMTYGTQYYISSVAANDDGTGMPVLDIILDPCLSVAPGTPITFLRPSEATLSGNQTLCSGDAATLTLNYDAPISIDIVIFDGTDYDTIANVADGYQFQVTPNTMTTYSITEALTTDPFYCPIDVNGTAVVNINAAPDTTSVDFICSNTGTQYQVIIDIAGGDPSSYVVNGDPGTLVGGQFTSAFLNSNAPYAFEITDINNCAPVSVTGIYECACSTYAGEMNLDPLEYCDGGVVSVSHNNQQVLDGNDAFGFVMHDSPTATLGNIIATNISGAFTFDSNSMNYGTIYYISAVAADDDGNSFPVLDINSDPCLSVTLGTPVTFLRSSEVILSGGETLCMGDTAILSLSYNAPINIDIVVFDGTDYDTIFNVGDGDQFEVYPTMTSTYTLSEAITSDAAYCDIDVSGSAVVTTIARAIPDNVQLICDATNTQFQVIFNIIGGNAGGYTVTGDPGNLDLATSTFTSSWYPNNSNYTFTVTDGQGCPPYELSGSHFCECTTDAGTVSSSDEVLCEGNPYLIYYNNDGTLDGDDVLGFVLHDGTATSIGNPIMTNLNGIFNYDPVLVYGQTYYVTAVVSNDDGTGFPNLDENVDPCFSATDGLPITYYPSVMAGISAPDSICSNEPIPVTFHFDGTGLYNVEFFDGTSVITLENLLDGYVQSFDYTSDVQFYLESVSTANCEGTLDPTATTVDIEVFETAAPIDIDVICLMDTAYIITFDIVGGDESTMFVTGDAGTLTGRTFISDPIVNNTPYSFTINDGSICAPVDVVGIHNCSCDPTMAPFINVNNQLTCTNQVNGAIEVIHPNNGGVPPYTYTWSSGASDKSLEDIGPGVYYVTISDANGCSVIDSIEFMAPDPIEAEALALMPSCPGEDDGSITFENITGGSGNYTIEVDGGFNLSDKEYIGFSAGSFTATITDDSGCSWNQEIVIEEPEELLLDLGVDTLISIGDSIRLLPVTNGFVDTFMWSQDQLLPCPTCFSQVVYPFTSTVYQLTIIDPNGCQTTDDIIIRVDDQRPVYIPNLFHPNGDGKNDMFTVYGGHVVEEVVAMKVYDRWGEQMHASGGYPPNDESYGWDGTFKGRMMNPNVYIYVVEIRFTDGTTKMYKGDVSIIR